MTINIPVSTVPKALVYLQAAITAQVANDPYKGNVYICLGDPGIEDPLDIIQIDSNVERTAEPWNMVHDGQVYSLYEKYGIVWKVSCARKGDTEADIAPVVMQRAYQLVGYIETAIRLDMSFGGLLVVARPGQTQGGAPKWGTSGAMLSEITGRVQCEAGL